MACVRYRFKSAKEFQSLPIVGNFISVGDLKHLISESARFGHGKDFDLRFTDAQTGEVYENESTLIPKQSSILVQRVAGPPRERIVVPRDEKSKEVWKTEDRPQKQNQATCSSTTEKYGAVIDSDEFGDDALNLPAAVVKSSTANIVAFDEDSKIMALVSTPSLDYTDCAPSNFGRKLDCGRRIQARNLILENKIPPEGYICYRCGVSGHFIHHCPTNGDRSYDNKRFRPVVSRTALVSTSNDDVFEREVEGMPSTRRPMADLPPELLCPLCKSLMRDAVLTSKCCFSSFCDKCIRDYVIAKLTCVCGATNVMADDLIPNKTLRETIKRLSESSSASSTEHSGVFLNALGVTSACHVPKAPTSTTPTLTASTITQSSASLSNADADADERKTDNKIKKSEGNTAHSLQKHVKFIENETSGPSNPTIHTPQNNVSVQDESDGNNNLNHQLSFPRVRKNSKKPAREGRLMAGSDTEYYKAPHYAEGLCTNGAGFSCYPGTVPYVYMPDVYGFAPAGGSSLAVTPYWMQPDVFGGQMQANMYGSQMQANVMQDFSWMQCHNGSRMKDNMNCASLKSKINVVDDADVRKRSGLNQQTMAKNTRAHGYEPDAKRIRRHE